MLTKYQLIYYYLFDQKSIDVTGDRLFNNNNNIKCVENKIMFGKHYETKELSAGKL